MGSLDVKCGQLVAAASISPVCGISFAKGRLIDVGSHAWNGGEG
jgi:hypothetical protein